MSSTDPQNPYHSYMVEASAGSGKTYQLSKRFLMLVGAGAAPETILTMTFTVKAAQEMRARIIEEATTLLVDSTAQAEYSSRLAVFYAHKKEALSSKYALAEPKTAVQVAQDILSATQKLRILTIDSLFHEWVMRFLGLLTDSSLSSHHQKKMVSSAQIQLLDQAAVTLLHDEAWTRLLQDEDSCRLFLQAYEQIRSTRDPIPIMQLKTRIQEAYHHVSHLFYLEQSGKTGFQQYTVSTEASIPCFTK